MLASIPRVPKLTVFPSIAARLLSSRTYKADTRGILDINDEVNDALASQRPIVALESTIITHGLPFPDNIEMATQVEDIIRAEGAVPATMAFLDGSAKVGLNEAELSRLATAKAPWKVSRRDIPYVLSHKLAGGTTISATMILAHMAGIKLMATGGLGGVHRGVSENWDISADLEELGRTPVAVVCSGPKSILDIEKTVEYLETKGCHLSTYSPENRKVNVPGFFTVDSGVPSPFHFTSPADAATTIHEGTKFGLQSGYVLCVPAPEQIAMDPEIVNAAIEAALEKARLEGVKGKLITPFLLKNVWEQTGGDSVKTNIEFVKNNARIAAKIACSMSPTVHRTGQEATVASPIIPSGSSGNEEGKNNGETRYFAQSNLSEDTPLGLTESIHMPLQLKPQASMSHSLRPPLSSSPSVVVIGALSQDITCTLETDNISVSSYPGRITTSLGGTAYNVALASAYSNAPTRLISCIGDREEEEIAKSVSPALDVSGVLVSSKERTPRYVSTNDSKGDLIVACADMDAVYNMNPQYIKEQLESSKPDILVFDGNLGVEQCKTVLDYKKENREVLTVFEPTSVPKAARIAEQDGLGLFPNASIDIATPNYLELMSLFEEFSFRERFDVYNWFPIIDQLPLSDHVTRMKLDIFARSHRSLEKIIESGLFQASVQLLPYIPNLFVTNGPNGVLTFQLIENLRDRSGGVKDGPSSVYILSRNRSYGVLIQHYPVTATVEEEAIKSVNGIGDTFCGALVAQLARSRELLRDDGPLKRSVVSKSMHAASLSLQTYQAVNSEITTLFERN